MRRQVQAESYCRGIRRLPVEEWGTGTVPAAVSSSSPSWFAAGAREFLVSGAGLA